jgi:hypothetical protein
MGLVGRLVAGAVMLALLAPSAGSAASKGDGHEDLARRVHELERQNAELVRRLQRLEDAARTPTGSVALDVARTGSTTPPASNAAVTTPAAPVRAAAETPPEVAIDSTEDVGLGLIARYGNVRASFQMFGDAGFGWSNPSQADTSNASFAIGSIDLFSTAQIGEHFQTLSEIVFEGDSADNEVEVDVERLWGQWTFGDALYLKLGREHSPQSRWNRRYHHGKWLWTSATQPFLARFEDDGGPLQVHQVGVEAGGRLATGAGVLEYTAVAGNGRGRKPSEVQNFGDRNDAKAYDVGFGFSPAPITGFAFGGDVHFDEIPHVADDPTRLHAIRETVETGFLEYFASPLELLGEAAFIQHDDRTSNRTFHHASGYLQAGWHVGAFTPFARVDVRRMSLGDPFYAPSDVDLDSTEGVLGVRYDLSESVAVKLEGGVGRDQRRATNGRIFTGTFERLAAQLAWVF